MKEMRIKVSTTCGLKSAVQVINVPEWVSEISEKPFEFEVQSAYNKAHCFELEVAIKQAYTHLANEWCMDVEQAVDTVKAMNEEDIERLRNSETDSADMVLSILSLKEELEQWEAMPTLDKVTPCAGGLIVALKLTKAQVKVPEWYGNVYDEMVKLCKLGDAEKETVETIKACRLTVLDAWNRLYASWGREPIAKITRKAFNDVLDAVSPKVSAVQSKTKKDGTVTRAGFIRKTPALKKSFPVFLANFYYYNGFAIEEDKKQEVKELNLF